VPAARSLVTGAAGFIGAALARRLVERGDHVTALAGPSSDPWRLEGLRDVAEVLEVDLRDADAVARTMRAARPE
jgi:dihydroflavonol-4-reductase